MEAIEQDNLDISAVDGTSDRHRTIRFKKLILQGFKSFPDTTELVFNENICAIVGPNGCGKSNILDALRWVLGEQGPSQLRARAMADIIFNGSANRKPVGMTEITLVIDCPAGTLPLAYEEIEITRRLYRSGESEYQINRVPCRLKDITDLFLDTGIGRGAYALIEQGRVDALVTARPDERRTFLEQIAGIEKYKVRKKEALSKLASTETNLARVKDVVTEVNTRRISLARQARKAIKYRTIKKERDDMTRVLAGGRYARLQDRLRQQDERAEILENHIARNAARLGLQSVALTESRKQVDTAQDILRNAADEIDQLERRIDYIESRIRDQDERYHEIEKEIEHDAGEADALERKNSDLDKRGHLLDEESANLKTRLAVLIEESAFQEEQTRKMDSTLKRLRNTLSEARSRRLREITEMAALKNRLTSIAERRSHLARRINDLDAEILRINTEETTSQQLCRDVEVTIADQEVLLSGLKAELDDARKRRSDIDHLRQDAGERLRVIDSEKMSVDSRLKSLREILAAGDGLDSGVKAVLDRFNAGNGTSRQVIYGTVADLYDTDSDSEQVVAIALYPYLQDIVALGSPEMNDVCSFLTDEKLGRVTVRIPEAGPRQDDRIPVNVSGIVPVRSLVNSELQLAGMFDRLLAGVFLAPDAETAALSAREYPHAVFVSPCGMRWEPGGARTIGRAPDNRLAYRQRRTEVRHLEIRAEKLQTSHSRIGDEYRAFEREWRSADADVSSKQTQLTDMERNLAVFRRDLEHRRGRVEQVVEQRNGVHSERLSVQKEIEQLSLEHSGLTAKVDERESQSGGSDTIDELEKQLETTSVEMTGLQTRLTEYRMQVRSTQDRIEFTEKERTGLSDEIRRLQELSDHYREQILKKRGLLEDGSTKKNELLVELKRLIEDSPIRKNRLETLKARLVQVKRAEEEIAAEVTELERVDRQMERDMADIRVEKASLNSALQALIEEAECDPSEEADVLGRVPDDAEIDDWKKQADVLQESLNLFSDVNLAAEHEHRELVERSRFLDEQLQDLDSAIASLRNTIQQINRASKLRFTEAFTAVNDHFSRIFQGLFDGGEASLELIDPNDPLETGVDIICRPPGKRARTIDLLSGGEKALAALALLLAGFRYKPSPLLFLDEVDAPLDDHNVVRFTRFLKTLAEVTQVVMITHNSVTMEVADILYGVTMENPGISKLVSARLTMFAG
ncbi:chromosome segregation protein SMC [bacterium]|nr:chromosome segregation protein SMC [candidate division CSSED10-310 bacterium]